MFLFKIIHILNRSLLKSLADKNLCSFHEKKEKVNMVANFVQFFLILEDVIPSSFKTNTDFRVIIDCLNIYYEFLKTTKLLYMTCPEIISFNNIKIDIKELWLSVCEAPQQYYFKNGGTLFAFCNILLKLLNFLIAHQLNEHIPSVFGLIKKVFVLEKENSFSVTKSFTGKIKETPHPMKSYIEDSNTRFTKYIVKQIDNFNERNSFLHLAKKGESMSKSYEMTKSSEKNEVEIFHYLLYRMLKLVKLPLTAQILQEICVILARIFRINGQEFVNFLKNVKLLVKNVPLKNLDEKKQLDKENFLRICSEMNENDLGFSLPKAKSSNFLNLEKGKEDQSESNKDYENIVDFFNKFTEIEKINPEIIEKIQGEVIPKAKAYFKKSAYLVI